jgi:hypothetical protein
VSGLLLLVVKSAGDGISNQNVDRGGQVNGGSGVKKKKTRTLSLDGWAVAVALLLAALVRLGLLKHVGW